MTGMMTGEILFLGSNGRVGRLLRQVLTCPPPDLQEFARRPLIWQARQPQTGPDTLVWSPGGALPTGLRPQAVVALWGVTSGTATALAQNTYLARAAFDLACQTGARRVLHLSSAAIYGAPSGPVCEASTPKPCTPYGMAKLAMERAIADWQSQGSTPRNTILRLGNVAGADSLFANLATPLTLDRFAGGQGPSRSYIAPRDLARVIARLVTCPLGQLPEVANIAGPYPVPMADIARAAGVPIRWRTAPPGALERMDLATDTLRLLRLDLADSADPARLVAQSRTFAPLDAMHQASAG